MKRNPIIDNIAGILIIYMIVYHIFQWCDLSDINRSYCMLPLSFFMFWFFYKSGMFYKEKTCKEVLLGGEVNDSIYCFQLYWTSIGECKDLYGR